MKKILGLVLAAVFCLVMAGQGIGQPTATADILAPKIEAWKNYIRLGNHYPCNIIVAEAVNGENVLHVDVEHHMEEVEEYPGNYILWYEYINRPAIVNPIPNAIVKVKRAGNPAEIFITNPDGNVFFYASNGDQVRIEKDRHNPFSFNLSGLIGFESRNAEIGAGSNLFVVWLESNPAYRQKLIPNIRMNEPIVPITTTTLIRAPRPKITNPLYR